MIPCAVGSALLRRNRVSHATGAPRPPLVRNILHKRGDTGHTLVRIFFLAVLALTPAALFNKSGEHLIARTGAWRSSLPSSR